MASRIEDYALIGDCMAAALVARGGSIDWLCWPRFDSDACFAALLGDESHGRWLVAPQDPAARVRRQYRRNTLILETRFKTKTGEVTLIDFMPPRFQGMGSAGTSQLVRIVQGRAGGYREVRVGDPIPGAGRVEAIEKRGRRWVVVTSLGLIPEME